MEQPKAKLVAGLATENLALIKPGSGLGALNLGDTQERVFMMFPRKKNIDQVTLLPNCGTEYIWADLDSSNPGNLIIRLNDDYRVFQIESLTTKYHTQDGITVGATPDEVHQHYRTLRAYTYLGATSEATGNRPLIFWMDEKMGIAFSFAYSKSRRRRYLYEIIVYKPKSLFCPEGEVRSAENWKEIAPYSIELPDRSAIRISPGIEISSSAVYSISRFF